MERFVFLAFGDTALTVTLHLDFGESHYLSQPRYPSVQPKSHAWVDGFPHLGWLDLNMFYVLAFKLGRWPTIQEVKLKLGWENRVWMWSRPHLKTAEVEDGKDPIGRPQGWQLVSIKYHHSRLFYMT